MNVNQYIKTGSNESYTLPYLIEPLIPFIERFRKSKGIKAKKDLTIWCPFDLEETLQFDSPELGNITLYRSQYVEIFEREGYKVIASHLITDQDFFEYELDGHYDVIISNPPFQNKKLFFERALEFNKPFCLLNTASWLNDGGVFTLFKDIKLQLLMTNRRAVFFNDKGLIGNRPSFKSIYYCNEFLIDGDIQWFELPKKSMKELEQETLKLIGENK
jgi:hypothetical protein